MELKPLLLQYKNWWCIILLILLLITNDIAFTLSNDREFKIKLGDLKLQIEGRIMFDSYFIEGVYLKEKSGSNLDIRDTQFTLVGKLNKYWKTELQFNSDEKDSKKLVSIADANIKYTGWNALKLIVGKAKEPFGLEKLTSSSDVIMMEEAMATAAFAPSRNVGVNLSSDTDNNLLWSLGFYEIDKKNTRHNSYAITGRLIYQYNNLLHLGMAGSIRDLDGENYQIEERAEVPLADKIVTSAKIAVEQINLLGLESAWISGPFSLQIEYMMADIDAEVIANQVNYAGYYFQGSYFLTGESRSYEPGQFGKIKHRAKSGAWELTSRYSVLDARDNQAGVKATNVTIGLNYYINEQVRLMMNAINTHVTPEASSGTGNALSFRLQYDF